CLAAGGNTFPEYRDNIQGYVSAATGNYNQGNPGYRLQGVANQMRPPGFAQPNVQNNQNRFGQPQGFNRNTNFNQEQPYQATQSNQNFHLNELEKIKRMNNVSLKAMQNQIDMVKNELRNEKTFIQTSLSNQTNEIKNMMADLLQMNTASTLGSGTLPGNTIANPKGKLKAITTRSGLVTEGPTVPNPPKSINPERMNVDSLPPHIPYPSRMLKQKQQEKDDIQIQKFWNMFKQLHLNITLAEALVLMPKYQKLLKALLSNKEKLQELANTPLNENCSAIILKKLPEKLGDPGKFLIPCGFSELKCKALANLGASINLMPLSVWKKLGLPDLILTQMTLELANRAICTPDGIARDVFVPVGKPFLRTARALIDVYGEEMILCDGDERLTLNMKHNTANYSNHPYRESVKLINIFNLSSEDCLKDLVSNKQSGNPTFSLHEEIASPEVIHEIQDSKGCTFLSEELPDIDSFNDIHPHFDDDTLSGSTTFSANSLLEEFADELALISYPPDYDDNRACDIKSDIREIEFLLFQGEDSDFKDSIDQSVLTHCDDLFVDPTPEMFIDEQPLDYLFPPRFDVYPDDFLEIYSDATFDDDSFDSEGEKIQEAELLIDPLDLPCDILFEYDSLVLRIFPEMMFCPLLIMRTSSFDLKQALRGRHPMLTFLGFLIFSIPGFMKILANGFHYLQSLYSPVFNLGITFSYFQSQSVFLKPDEDFSCSRWKEYSSLGCSSVLFLSPLIRSSMGGIWSNSFNLKQALRGRLKKYSKKDKIGSKPYKNGKRGEAGKSQKQLQ
nr:reverse transcriptase domain-containing protein [Tanacetum cinerariifolium]